MMTFDMGGSKGYVDISLPMGVSYDERKQY